MIRNAFLETASEARALITTHDVQRLWNEPSALRGLTVGALAAHLGRAISTVEFYVHVALPDSPRVAVTADAYYVAVQLTRDIDDELNTSIRERSIEAAIEGHAAVVAEVDRSLASVTDALADEPSNRNVMVIFDIVMTLDEYLVTRLVELATHIDDLAFSVGRATPVLSEVTRDCVLGALFMIARRRHGDVEVLRALTRAERSSGGVFPVL